MPRANFLHAALLVPPLQTAETLPQSTTVASLSTSHTDSRASRTIDGVTSSYHALFHEWLAPELRGSPRAGTELSLRAAISGFDETLDRFSLFDANGGYVVRDEERLALGEASRRHDNLARIDLGAKVELLHATEGSPASAVMLSAKVPVARAGDLSSAGTYDVAATLLETVPLGAITLHANVGGTWPLGEQTLFHRDAGIDLNPFAHGAVGADWAVGAMVSLDVQLRAQTSAFRDVEFLARDSADVVLGARWFAGRSSFLDFAAGTGVDHSASATWQAFLAWGIVF